RETLKRKTNGSDCTSPIANNPGSKKDAHFCAVCSDYASGYHYGVWSCEGCKAFFKRSIQGHNDYICPATNQCTIDKNRRKSCQACRLRKCYEVGMMKCGELGMALLSAGVLALFYDDNCKYFGSCLKWQPATVDVSAPLSSQLIVLSGFFGLSYTHFSLLKQTFNKLFYAICITLGFIDLSLYDQVRLLESCWMEVLMIGLMWRSIDHPGKLIFAPDLVLDRDEGKCVEGILEIFDMLLAMTSRFRELKLQHKEYLCVKAMILLNSSMFPLSAEEPESNKKLHHLLNVVTEALVWVIAKSGIPSQQQTTRLANLLMLLSHVRHA
ncbi:ESR2 protein, partial [Spizella passerina]|nr:ESR2 protein [Spizella passerina]